MKLQLPISKPPAVWHPKVAGCGIRSSSLFCSYAVSLIFSPSESQRQPNYMCALVSSRDTRAPMHLFTRCNATASTIFQSVMVIRRRRNVTKSVRTLSLSESLLMNSYISVTQLTINSSQSPKLRKLCLSREEVASTLAFATECTPRGRHEPKWRRAAQRRRRESSWRTVQLRPRSDARQPRTRRLRVGGRVQSTTCSKNARIGSWVSGNRRNMTRGPNAVRTGMVGLW